MAFYKKTRINKGTKENPSYQWIPRAVLVGKQITVKELSKRISAESTVSEADVRAVLTSLPSVIEMYMRMGRSVKLDGIGKFQYTINCAGKAVDSPQKVSARQITDVRVRFLPEQTFSAGRTSMTRAMAEGANTIEWIDIDSLTSAADAEETTDPGTVTPDPGTGDQGGTGTIETGDTGGTGDSGDTGGGTTTPDPNDPNPEQDE